MWSSFAVLAASRALQLCVFNGMKIELTSFLRHILLLELLTLCTALLRIWCRGPNQECSEPYRR